MEMNGMNGGSHPTGVDPSTAAVAAALGLGDGSATGPVDDDPRIVPTEQLAAAAAFGGHDSGNGTGGNADAGGNPGGEVPPVVPPVVTTEKTTTTTTVRRTAGTKKPAASKKASSGRSSTSGSSSTTSTTTTTTEPEDTRTQTKSQWKTATAGIILLVLITVLVGVAAWFLAKPADREVVISNAKALAAAFYDALEPTLDRLDLAIGGIDSRVKTLEEKVDGLTVKPVEFGEELKRKMDSRKPVEPPKRARPAEETVGDASGAAGPKGDSLATATTSWLPTKKSEVGSGYSVADVTMACHGLKVKFSEPLESMSLEELWRTAMNCEEIRRAPPVVIAALTAAERAELDKLMIREIFGVEPH